MVTTKKRSRPLGKRAQAMLARLQEGPVEIAFVQGCSTLGRRTQTSGAQEFEAANRLVEEGLAFIQGKPWRRIDDGSFVGMEYPATVTLIKKEEPK